MLKSHFFRPMPSELLFEDFSSWLAKQQTATKRAGESEKMTCESCSESEACKPFDIFYQDFARWLTDQQLTIMAHQFWDKLTPCQMFDYVIRSLRPYEQLRGTALPRDHVTIGGSASKSSNVTPSPNQNPSPNPNPTRTTRVTKKRRMLAKTKKPRSVGKCKQRLSRKSKSDGDIDIL
ncbi:hypothetical protein ACLKA7_012547 [Drosophila subpalustris]